MRIFSLSPFRIVLFVALFGAATYFPILLSKSLFKASLDEGHEESVEESSGTVPIVMQFDNNQGALFTAKDDPRLNPSPELDYAVFSWIRLKSIPEPNTALHFVAKLDAAEHTRNGFSFGLERSGKDFHLVVTWRGAEGIGNTYRFAKTVFFPREWYAVSFVFSQGRYLSAYRYRLREDAAERSEVESLGAFELETPVIPSPKSDFLVGYPVAGPFEARIGPFGLLRGTELPAAVQELLPLTITGANLPSLSSDSVEPILFVAEESRNFVSLSPPIVTEGGGFVPREERRKNRQQQKKESKGQSKKKKNSE